MIQAWESEGRAAELSARMRTYQAGALCGAVCWLSCGLLAPALEPGAVDPIWPRLVIAAALALLGIAVRLAWQQRRVERVFTAALLLCNVYAFVLLVANTFSPVYTLLMVAHTAAASTIPASSPDRAVLGSANLVMLAAAALWVDTPQVSPALVVVVLVITEIVTALVRHQHVARLQQLLQRRQLLDAVLQSDGDAILLIEPQTYTVQFANQAAATMFDRPAPGDLLGLSSAALHGARHTADGDPEDVWRGTLPCLRPGKDPVMADAVVSQIAGLDLVIVRLSDATKRLASEHTLREARDSAESGLRARDSFLALVSHELRTPLNGILGALQLARQDGAPLQALLPIIEDSTQDLDCRIRQILSFSAALSTDAPEDRPLVACDLASLLERLVVTALGTAHTHTINTPRSMHLWVDADRLEIVTSQLLENIRHHAPGAAVAISARHSDDTLEITITDDGPGLSDAALRLAARPFVLGDIARRSKGGMGLGLPLCHRLLAQSRGALRLETSPSGTVAILSIPATCRPVAPQQPRLERLRVLVVDDNPTNRMLLQQMLRRLGAEVGLAEDGPSGINAALTEEYDLVLMDLHMPGCTGWEATATIHAKHPNPPPIVAVTASSVPRELNAVLDSGAVDIVHKPVKLEQLRSLLDRLQPLRASA